VTTIRWYMREIYSKLDVHSRAELIACARKMGLLT
jgi:DNA-binding NarL/FixJ family response regulator